MKIRNGFVSNSSSSSFIIAYKKDYANDESCKCPTCGNAVNIVKILNQLNKNGFSSSDDLSIMFTIKESVKSDNSGYDDEYYDDEISPIIDEFFKKNDKEVYEIMGLRVGYSISWVSELIESDKNIHIIRKED